MPIDWGQIIDQTIEIGGQIIGTGAGDLGSSIGGPDLNSGWTKFWNSVGSAFSKTPTGQATGGAIAQGAASDLLSSPLLWVGLAVAAIILFKRK